ncbi:SCO1860 family LAETG-anchored protein [Kitasatospora sp. NPDC096147]|uniref:SCO1860 family LAETG-anchored protein n=1 Tax=Kitasatospora sp. NPDC096147 TaxID=3364093 RepID=UPI0037FCB82C
MHSTVLRAAAATALVVALATPARAAEPSVGKASAVTAELDLDVSVLGRTAAVPVDISLNKVQAPASKDGSVLTTTVAGVDQGRPVELVRAEVGRSTTRADADGASARVQLTKADLGAPGLVGAPLLVVEALTAEVTCPVDGPPTAKVDSPAKLTVLGKPVTLSVSGPTRVNLDGVGTVEVGFSKRTTTTSTAAASALEVQLDLNPLQLNVAKVTGKITVASVSCEKPAPRPSASPTPVASPTPAASPSPEPSKANRAVPAVANPTPSPSKAAAEQLASTGSSGTGVLLGAAGALLVVGLGALRLTRRRRAHARKR